MTHVTCRLTAKVRDQLRNPTLGNRVWAEAAAVYTEYAKSIVDSDDHDLSKRRHDTSVVGVSGSVVVRVAVNKHNDRK